MLDVGSVRVEWMEVAIVADIARVALQVTDSHRQSPAQWSVNHERYCCFANEAVDAGHPVTAELAQFFAVVKGDFVGTASWL